MDNVQCLICGAKFSSYKSLHLHIGRKETLSVAEYYHKFYPRFDLFTKELINYTTRDKYMSGLFNSKKNLVDWFSSTQSNLLKECGRVTSQKSH